MSPRILAFAVSVSALLALAASAQARTVQVDMSDAFNADVIVNGTTLGNIDETQDPFDLSETSLITQGAARVLDDCAADPDGLPNTGRFAATGRHPLVDLAYDNRKNSDNARRSAGPDSYRVKVPTGRYRAMHVFASSGNGSSVMKVKLVYKGASEPAETLIIRDWFDPSGFGYTLTDGHDRAQTDGSVCFDDDTTAIWGFKLKAKKSRQLKAVKVTRPAFDEGDSVLNVFGMTGVGVGARR